MKTFQQFLLESVPPLKFVVDGDFTKSDEIVINALLKGEVVGTISATYLLDIYEYELSDDFSEEQACEMFPNNEAIKLNYLSVEEKERGKKIGVELFRRMMQYLEDQGHTHFYLNASPMGFGGAPLSKLVDIYKRFGFRVILDQGKNVLMIKTN